MILNGNAYILQLAQAAGTTGVTAAWKRQEDHGVCRTAHTG
jgi:hypothetical protein